LSQPENDAVVQANARFLQAAVAAVEHWNEALPISVTDSARIKFRVCFPLVAHALNHASSGLANVSKLPFVAATNARVAFERALAAQWVLLTHEGEIRLVRHMEYGYLTQAKAFARATGYPDDLKDIVEIEPAAGTKRAWSIEMACARWA
jgi:predicted Zn-dependent protease